MAVEVLLGAVMLGAAVMYALTGGADYGGGLWDLFATGPRAARQRETIEQAIAPIWEANHVWLIFIIVVLFTGFPKAFSAISVALHIPLTLMLLGIVARGAAFTFRAYDRPDDHVQRRWGLVFSMASTATPLLLGVVVGALASGGIVLEQGQVTSGFFSPWADRAFPWAVGLLTLALFAYLAAVYLVVEVQHDEALARDFRARAIAAWAVAAAMAGCTLWLARGEAPRLYAGLVDGGPTSWLMGATVVLALGALGALLRSTHGLARTCAALQVAFIVAGWGLAQAPELIAGALTLSEASAPAHVQRTLLLTVAVGAPPLAASVYYLFRVFKAPER